MELLLLIVREKYAVGQNNDISESLGEKQGYGGREIMTCYLHPKEARRGASFTRPMDVPYKSRIKGRDVLLKGFTMVKVHSICQSGRFVFPSPTGGKGIFLYNLERKAVQRVR